MDAFVTRRVVAKASTTNDDDDARKRRRVAPTNDGWRTFDDSLLARLDAACEPRAKIAAFDLDDTLQKTKSGAKAFAARADDFTTLNEHVPRVLRALHDDGYKICIFSNQGGVKGALDGKRATSVRARLALLATTLETPFQFYRAKQLRENDVKKYRKGEIGMWRKMVAEHNGGVAPDLKASFFVGDAAGRAQDHSAVDKEFAENVGVRFFVPEQMFVEGEAWK